MFRKVKRRVDGRRNFDGDISKGFVDDLTRYPHRLSFYRMPPLEEITLEEFETWAIDRLKVLLEIESCQSRGKSFKEMSSIVLPILDKLLPLNPPSKESSSLYQERKKDHYSHFILRLAFCRSEELRSRFVKAETALFRIRYQLLSLQEQREFVDSIDLPWEEVSDEERDRFRDQLLRCSYGSIRSALMQTVEYQRTQHVTDEQISGYMDTVKFYRLPFEYVPELVSTRQTFLHKGYAYVGEFQRLSLIATEFSNFLVQQLQATMRALPTLDEDDRLVPVLNNLSKGYVSIDYNGYGGGEDSEGENSSGINAENISQFVSDMPLCMQRLMEGLQMNHHLRYGGRQELSLFLKGIGLNAEEALKFWQQQFTAAGPGSMTMEKFNKEYRYNFRHSYGLEGGHIRYKPWDCRTILSKPAPNKSEFHGCPYRDLRRGELSFQLQKLGLVDDTRLGEVLDLSEKGEYQTACTKVFELVNRDKIDSCLKQGLKVDESSIVHPNQYFDRSRYLDQHAEIERAGG
ncbi:DEKNAAC102000 [Brettanomyces naardenensis]|uniref:DNA primase large subunit n=1 Tax=Brettanomyces naardenensis TaxID=13370 RepID=A0A448YJD7_BRENA|nr:DEKNAAC102000 [Brettanomyces naardenensis]